MIRRGLRLFRRDDEGGVNSIEFAILFPLFLFFLVAALEISWLAVRVAMFERGVDFAIREIRLSTGTAPNYAEVKTLICEQAKSIENCSDHLRLEMINVDPRNWNGVLADATCSDQSEEINPPDPLSVGIENELMIMRACARLLPLVPAMGIAQFFNLGADDRFQVYSLNAFVQEPTS
ncbi:MAG: pilus assembly protein [Rhodobacteraceae bacterium]|nr:pilus assembly protein [Paracoccaceae bacterium]